MPAAQQRAPTWARKLLGTVRKQTMEKETLETQKEIIDLLQERDITITGFDCTEYIRGDPTVDDNTVTGAEIEIQAYISLQDLEE